MYHRLCWLRGGYGVRMSVHDLPSAIFGPEDARDTQSHGANILTPANLGPVALHLHDAGKLGGNELRRIPIPRTPLNSVVCPQGVQGKDVSDGGDL